MDDMMTDEMDVVKDAPNEPKISGTSNSFGDAMLMPEQPQRSSQPQFILIQRTPTSTGGQQIARIPIQGAVAATSTTPSTSVSSSQDSQKGPSVTFVQPQGPRKVLSTNRQTFTFNQHNLIPVQFSQGNAIILNSMPANTASAKPQLLPKGSPEKLVSQAGSAQIYLPLSFTTANATVTVRPIAPRGAAVPKTTEQDKKKQPQLVPKMVGAQPQQILLPAPVAQGGTVTFSAQNNMNKPSIQNLGNNVLRMPSGQLMQAVIGPVQVRASLPPGAVVVSSTSKSSRDTPDPRNGDDIRVETKPVKKPCNCTKSQCLKLYCDCFANGEFCSNCNCQNCANNIEHEVERSRAIKACLERNPQAFHPKIGKARGAPERRHTKGCHCKRSGCLKNYCECYEAKIMCSTLCRCTGCRNFEDSPERKTLMHLADAAEVRVLQQNAARSKLDSQLEAVTSKPLSSNSERRLPFSFITSSVASATCECLLERAEEAETRKYSEQKIERLIIDEFERSLLQIIQMANKSKGHGV